MSRDKNLQDFSRLCTTWPSLCQGFLPKIRHLENRQGAREDPRDEVTEFHCSLHLFASLKWLLPESFFFRPLVKGKEDAGDKIGATKFVHAEGEGAWATRLPKLTFGSCYCRFLHDVTKIQPTKLEILLIFYSNDVKEQLKTHIHKH